MTLKQHLIASMKKSGKANFEICRKLGINSSNLHSTLYQMRRKGIDLKPREAGQATPTLPLSPMQRTVLLLYMEKMPVPQIALKLQINCTTVMNHAAEGFKRLGLTIPGIDRIAALRPLLEPPPAPKVTMEDPFFN